MVNKYTDRWSPSLVIWDMQIKTTMRHYSYSKLAIFFFFFNGKKGVDRDVEKLETLYITGRVENDGVTL